MRYLYKGKTKIGKIHMKTKVDTSFITAGPEDIAAGKKTINGNYQEITGTMDISATLSELTSDATATSADITAGKIGYVNGERLIGTSPRTIDNLLMNNSVVDSYTVADGETINAGDFVLITETQDTSIVLPSGNSIATPFSTSTTAYSNIIKLNNSKLLVVHSHTFNRYEGHARIVNLNGISMNMGAYTVFNTMETRYEKIIKLNNNDILVVYSNTDSNNNITGECKILTLNNDYTSITVSNSTTFHNGKISGISIEKLTDNKYIIIFISSNVVYSKIITINNTNIILGDSINIITSNNIIKDISISNISPSKVLITYVDGEMGKISDISILRDNITLNNTHVFVSKANQIGLTKMSDYKFLLLYANTSELKTYAQIVYYNRDNIKLIAPTKIADRQYGSITSIKIATNKVFTIFSNISAGVLGCLNITLNPQNSISISTLASIPFGEPNGLGVVEMSPGIAVVMANDNTTTPSTYAYLRAVSFIGRITTSFGGTVTTSKFVAYKSSTSGNAINGVANTSGTSGEMIEVITPRLS